jgi:hypothetical protein
MDVRVKSLDLARCGELQRLLHERPLAGLVPNAPVRPKFAVGTSIAGRPPHRSGRARFEHPAPTSGV